MNRRVFSVVFAMISLLCLVASGGGCEAIVPDTIPGFTCTGTALNGCPTGSYCKGVGCTRCENTDVCDGYDNDCNGKVDDGALSDHDQDGYTICGHVDESTGKPLDVDCNDNDPNVHPGAQEVCNGIDDDCDGVIDNPDQVCPAGSTCAPALKKCVVACDQTTCPDPKVCDPKTQVCIDPTKPKTAIGGVCAADAECDTGLFCALSTILGGLQSNSVCSKMCCTSNDCPDAFVCGATGTGGRYCLAASKISRSVPGTGPGGAACSDGTTCRSGLCTGSKCVDTCCSDGDCSNGTSCTYQTVGGHSAYACGTPGGGHQAGNTVCGGSNDCTSDLCLDIGDPRGGTCMKPCCTSAGNNCGSVLGVSLSCIENGVDGASKDTFLICSGATGSGGKSFGTACTQNKDCLSNLCDATGSHACTDVCCTDTDCPGEVCRPDANGGLRCIQTPPPPAR
ncbi:MAG: putative metal-binding motif-containing protein [Polyangiaceae bacterium]